MRRGGGASGRMAAGDVSASTEGAAALGGSAAPAAWAAAAAMTAPGIAGGGAATDAAAAATGALAAATGPGAAAGRPSAGAPAMAEADAVTGGFTTTGPAGGLAAMAGVDGGGAATTPVRVELAAGGAAIICGAWRGMGTTLLGAGFGSGAADALAGGALGAETGGTALGPGFAAAGMPAGAGTLAAGRATTGPGVVTGGAGGRTAGWASCCFLSRICLAMSPGLWAWDQSIFGLTSASCRFVEPLPAPRPLRMWVRTRSASSVSIELECVFFSVTPTAVRASRISLLLTSSSRANSLIRTVLIRPRVVRNSHRSLALHTDTPDLWVGYSFIIAENAWIRGSIPAS